MSDLPQNWLEISFMDIFDIQGGTQPPKKEFLFEPKDGYIRLLQIRDFGGKPAPTYVKIKSSLKTVDEEDVLIARYGASIGRICTGMNGAYNVALSKVVIPKEVYKRYVFFLLKSSHFQTPILQTQRSAQDGFNKEDLKEITIPFAPFDEQKRIVEKLEKLLGKVEAAQARLDKIPAILKRFRQAVLAAACSGKLTADWRENKEINLETDLPFDLPKNWKSENLGQLCEIKGGIQKTPHRKPVNNKYPYLRVANVYRNELRLDEITYFELFENELERWKLQKGDLLVVEGNGSSKEIGRCAVWNEEIENCVHQNHLIRCRPKSGVDSKFILTFLNSPFGIDEMMLLSSSTSGLFTLSVGKISKIIIPFPPLEEQKEIVRRVEDLFKFADQIEARYKRARSYTDKLTQSILAKAFRGELVSQDERDESASLLLERIKAEKADNSPDKNRKPKKKAVNQSNLFE